MSSVIILVVLVIILLCAVMGTVEHARGNSGCCGGSGKEKIKKKKLDGEVVAKKAITINGMVCKNCKITVERYLNRIDGVVAEVDLKKGQAIVAMDRDVSDSVLRSTIVNAGFEFVGIEDVQ